MSMQSAHQKAPKRGLGNRLRLTELALSVALAFTAVPAFAQNTTSAIGGLVTSADGNPTAGAQVTIKHVESGSTANTTTDATGHYVARGLRPGGPYTITITKNGVTETRENVYLQLAETASLDAKLGGQAVATVTVTGSASQLINKSSMGASTNVSHAELEAMASIARNLQDIARVDPRVVQTDKVRGEMSIAGQNSRYNTITIDGVNISDTFGLEANTLPMIKQPISIDAIQSVQVNVSNYDVTQKGYIGGNINAVTKSGTNEFHGDAYYVFRNDRYAGKRYNINNGTYFDPPASKDTTAGFSLGGPILQDKLFFFINHEEYKSLRNAPSFGPIGSTQTNVGIAPSTIAGAQAIAKSKYGVDLGAAEAQPGTQVDVKDTLLRLDWNISDNHRAFVRYTKTEQTEPIFPDIDQTHLSTDSHWYNQGKTLETAVAQVVSDWTDNFSTEVKLSQRNYHSEPHNNADMPMVALQISGPLAAGAPSGLSTANRFFDFGTERSRHFNILDTKTTDVYLGGNWSLGKHEVKFGTDYQKNKVFNAFLQDTKGNYTFGCINSTATFTYNFGTVNCGTASASDIEQAVLENFSRGRPLTYQVQVPAAGTTLSDAAAHFSMMDTGLFAQDTWTVTPALSFLYGFRYDMQTVDGRPAANAAAAAAPVAGTYNPTTGALTRQSGGFGYDNTNTIDGQKLFQPRVGFNYTLPAERPTQVRGGLGLFNGAAPTVWLSNPYSNTGVATRIVGCGGSFAACPTTDGTFSADPTKQPTSFAGNTPAANVDFLAPGLNQPSVWKANLGLETELPFFGVVFGAEWINTRVKEAIYYQHLNLGTATKTGTDGRQLFYTLQAYDTNCWTSTGTSITNGTCTGFRSKALSNPNFASVLLASKTEQGGGNVGTLSLTRPLKGGWGASFAYTYSNATEVSPLTSSVSSSNFNARSIFNPNEEVAANSAYLIKDRVNASLTWQKAFFAGYKTTVGMFYEGRSGKPYSWTYSNDLNGDGVSGNDLMYIPSSRQSGEVVFKGDTATSHANEDRFWAVVDATPELASAKGGVVKRNGSFSPWVNSVDMRVSQEIPSFWKGHKAMFSLDFLNIGNMINKSWGRINEPAFQGGGGQSRNFVSYAGLDAQGRYIYNVLPTVTKLNVLQDNGASQWAVQATVKYEF
jgi:hypothetical protein